MDNHGTIVFPRAQDRIDVVRIKRVFLEATVIIFEADGPDGIDEIEATMF